MNIGRVRVGVGVRRTPQHLRIFFENFGQFYDEVLWVIVLNIVCGFGLILMVTTL